MKREINLLKSYKDAKRVHLSRRTKLYIALTVLLLVLVGVGLGWMVNRNQQILAEIDKENTYIGNQENLAKVQNVTANDMLIDLLRMMKSELDILEETAGNYPFFDSDLIAVLQSPDCTLTKIAYDRSILTLELTCTQTNQPSAYVDMLEDSGLFSVIIYNGYTAGTNQSGYQFTVVAHVKAGEVRE